MSDIAIAKELGIPATEVRTVPNLYRRAALISLDVQHMMIKRANAKHQKGRV
jgi:hypothetical protein